MYKKLFAFAAIMAAATLSVQADRVANCEGNVNYTGSASGSCSYSASTDTYTISGCGADVWGSSDAFYYVYTVENLDTDFDYIVNLKSFSAESNEWAKAGLMVRECGYEMEDEEGNLTYEQTGDARYILIQAQRPSSPGDSRYVTAWRPQIGWNVDDNHSLRQVNFSYPLWQRVRRIGDVFYTYRSDDGINWILHCYQDTSDEDRSYTFSDTRWQVPMGSEECGSPYLSVGLFVTSHDASSNAATAVFTGFQKFVQTPVTFVTAPEDEDLFAGDEYTLNAKFAGYNPFTYTLKKGNTIINEGSTMGYSISINLGALAVSDSGSYTLEVENTVDGVKQTVSKTFKLNVTEDTEAPSVAAIRALGKEIGITFSEAVTDTAAQISAYTVSGNTVVSVEQKSATRVVLTLSKAISGNTDVSIKGIKDHSGNEFSGKATAIAYTLSNSGKPSTPGTASLDGGDAITISNWGMDYWYQYDEDTFVYRPMVGDFDIQARLVDMPLGARYSRGGICARVSLDEGTTTGHGAFAGINQFSTKYILWYDETASFGEPMDHIMSFDDYRGAIQFNWRPSTTESTTGDGTLYSANFNGTTENFSSHLGETFVRLVRIGNTFYGYYSTDNKATWTLKSSYTIENAPAKMYVGQHFALEAYQLNSDSDVRPDSLAAWLQNPDITFSASWADYNEGYVEAVDFVEQPESQSLQANAALTLKVTAIGDPLQYQWYKDGIALEESIAIQGTKTATLYLPYTAASDSGSYTCRIYNFNGDMPTSEAISDVALVSITAETEAPEIVDYGYDFHNKGVFVSFNEGMDLASLTNKANYKLTDKNGKSVAIDNIVVSKDGTYAAIVASALVPGESYMFSFSGLKDRSLNALPETEPVEFIVTFTKPLVGQWYDAAGRGNDFDEFVKNVHEGLTKPIKSVEFTEINYEQEDRGDNYGLFISGYIMAPETGYYRFATSSDDASRFYLSTDSSMENLSETYICRQTLNVDPYVYSGNSYQQSEDIPLVEGNLYYFEYFFWEDSGDEHFTLAWSLPSQGPTKIADDTGAIPSSNTLWVINPANTIINIVDQPTKVAAADQNPFEIAVDVEYSSDYGLNPPEYTWYIKNDSTGNEWMSVEEYNEIIDVTFSGMATSTLSCSKAAMGSSDGSYYLNISLAGKEVKSAEIVLEITDDFENPTATAKGSNTMEEIIITFSEPVWNAEYADCYEVPGLTINEVGVNYNDNYEVISAALYTSRQEEGKVYTVKYNGITDLVGNPLEQDSEFTAFVWYSGYALLEVFDKDIDFVDLYQSVKYNTGVATYRTDGLKKSPQIADTLEIHSTTFNLDYCVERISGYIIPEESGNYTFSGSCDDRFKMWISSDESVSNMSTDDEDVIATEASWCSDGERQWNYSGCTSKPVYLEAGQKYYYVASLQEDAGGDFLTLTWTKEGNAVQANGTKPILTGNLLGIYINPDSSVVDIDEQPEDQSAMAGETVTFSIKASTQCEYSVAIEYQWYAGENAIAGATSASVDIVAAPEYDGVPFYCKASIFGNVTISESAYLTTIEDTEAVVPEYVMGTGDGIIVVFDKPISVASATDISNFNVIGATVTEASMYVGPVADAETAALLQVSGIQGNVVTVEISGVENKSGVPMAETVTLQGAYTPLKVTNVYVPGATSGTGAIGKEGYAKLYLDHYDLYASGYDCDGAADACLFMYEEVDGDFDIAMRVEANEAEVDWSKVGLMFRVSLDAASAQINALSKKNAENYTQRRYVSGGGTSEYWPQLQEDGKLIEVAPVGLGSGKYPNNWLRFKREGNHFSAYRATSAEAPQTWTMIQQGDFEGMVGDVDCTMPAKGYVGIFATAHDAAVVGHYRLSNVDLNYVYVAPTSDENPFTGSEVCKNDSAVAPQPGSYFYDASTGIYNITGCGADLRGTSDGLYFVWQPVPEGDFQIVGKFLSVKGSSTGEWIKSGLMLREAKEDGSQDGFARLVATHVQRDDITSTGTVASPYLCWRNASGADINDSNDIWHTDYLTQWPNWQKLVKIGDVVSAYIAYTEEEPTEADWISLGEVDTAEWADGALGSKLPLYVGMFVTANNADSNDAHAQISNVSVSAYSPVVETPELFYEYTGETIILKWAASAQASLEVAPTATGEWTILNPEEIQIVDGVCTYEFPVSDENSFFRLAR